jgi:hypothetical protein
LRAGFAALRARRRCVIHQLVYASRETYPLRADDLIRLLLSARERNRRADVSGVLLYRDGWFMQLLEGDEAGVLALYALIAEDPRHGEVELLLARACDARLMQGWSMGYADAPTADGRDAFEGLRSERGVIALLERGPSEDAVAGLLRRFLQDGREAVQRAGAG